MELQGDHVATIALLTGATVTVCGARDAGGPLRVSSFELREVDGMPAYLGTLREVDGTFRVAPGARRPPVPLADVPDRLRASAGRMVWVAGAWRDGTFAVSSFGILEPAGD